MLCRICGKKDVHWSFKCPNIALQTTSVNRSSTEPPICQVCNQPADVIKFQEASVHLINLPKEICESDLIDLVRRFGPLTRVSLSMDEEADRKAAVVVYDRTKDAKKAISLLNGYDYYNSILRVEWAKPRQEAAYPPACPSCLEASENCVRVSNISEEITGPVFLDLFRRSGLLSVAYLDADKMTGSQTKCGIVEYFWKEDAENAIRLINGWEFFDLELQHYSRTKKQPMFFAPAADLVSHHGRSSDLIVENT
ncbi:hypothetical protein PR202_gb09541 [Eleusine coracana subsp. coracana]|uniref:RRM domain-containing protein n=1 Tax=Eleusine coracana subsp. coracana TaxID=191504 RepID=A0AAV5EI30_ELECO|nr:hypothetical protein PR202_gb09541 [Eleusine coracana subsp. coracana]